MSIQDRFESSINSGLQENFSSKGWRRTAFQDGALAIMFILYSIFAINRNFPFFIGEISGVLAVSFCIRFIHSCWKWFTFYRIERKTIRF
jgi:hypothetical protein